MTPSPGAPRPQPVRVNGGPPAPPGAQEADADHRQPVRDDGLGPAQEPGRLRAPGPLRGRGGLHRGAEPRDRDRPRGDRRRLRPGRRLRRRRHAERGRQRPRRAPTSRSRSSPAARPTSSRARSGSRTTSSTRPSTCSGWPTASSHAAIDLGIANGRRFVFSCGSGLDASAAMRVDRRPKLKATRRAVLLHLGRASPPSIATTCATRSGCASRPAPRSAEGVTVLAQNSDPFTYFGSRPVRVCEDVEIDDGTLSVAVLRRAAQRDMGPIVARVLTERLRAPGHRQIDHFDDVTEARVESVSIGRRRRAAAVPDPGRRRLHRRPRRARPGDRSGGADGRCLRPIPSASSVASSPARPRLRSSSRTRSRSRSSTSARSFTATRCSSRATITRRSPTCPPS